LRVCPKVSVVTIQSEKAELLRYLGLIGLDALATIL